MVQINYHNYEEFFILYVDNELGMDERRMVEDFVQLHPDLKEELALLQEFKFIPEESVAYPAKEELLQPSKKDNIHLDNYEEWFVLYIDEELTPEQKTETEQFILNNPSLQKEWEFFTKTRIQPVNITFPEKASLYRKEAIIRPAVFRWWRVAAAVLIIGTGIALFSISNKKHDSLLKENLVKKEIPVKNNNEPISRPSIQKQDDIFIAQSPLMEIKTKKSNEESGVAFVTSTKKETGRERNVPGKNQTIHIIPVVTNPEQSIEKPAIASNDLKNKPSNHLPVPENNPYVKDVSPKNNLAQNQPKAIVNPENTGVTNKSVSPSDIQQASYTDNAFTIEPSSGKKNKLRGFFRKLTRTFEKRTDINATVGDKLLVAGMAINLK